MNQNLDFFSLAILKRQNLKQNILKGNLCGNFFFWAVNKSIMVKITKTADCFTKTFPKWPRSLMEGMELKLCFVEVIVVLNIAAFMRQWVVHGEGFRSKYKAYFNWGMAKEFARFSEGIIGLFCIVLSVQLGTCNVPQRSYKSSVPRLFWMHVKLLIMRFCS